jgi:hypothetical protein
MLFFQLYVTMSLLLIKGSDMEDLTGEVRAWSLSPGRVRMLFFACCLSVVMIVPALVHNQWITGPLVNAVLFLSVVFVGPSEAVFLGLMPSMVALSTGLLPLTLALMVPFIMVGNAILVLSFYYLRGRNYLFRIGFPVLLKFAFLHYSVVYFLSGMMDYGSGSFAFMMSWPQLVTALVGGIIVYPIIKKRNDR